MTEFIEPTEGILLMRHGGRVLAVHCIAVHAVLEPIVNEPDIIPTLGFYRGPAITGYDVEASGVADRIWLWDGADPFARPEIAAMRTELDAADG